jgi:RNA polymerase sigma-70 factor (ECF subfamily)
MPDVSEPSAEVQTRVQALYASHSEELRRFVLGVVRDPDLTSDVMQATFSKALELGHLVHPETMKGWLFRVAFHEALELRRRRLAGDTARRKLADLGLVRSQEAVRPDHSLILGETVATVRKALGSLPTEQRRVVEARIYDDKTFAEIARDQKLPLGTVLTRMRLALKRLRDALETHS